jgi:hypothetical protein
MRGTPAMHTNPAMRGMPANPAMPANPTMRGMHATPAMRGMPVNLANVNFLDLFLAHGPSWASLSSRAVSNLGAARIVALLLGSLTSAERRLANRGSGMGAKEQKSIKSMNRRVLCTKDAKMACACFVSPSGMAAPTHRRLKCQAWTKKLIITDRRRGSQLKLTQPCIASPNKRLKKRSGFMLQTMLTLRSIRLAYWNASFSP